MTTATEFVPADLDATQWANLKPLYAELLSREFACAGCVEQLLLDRSELDSAASEARAGLYIDMSCHTADDSIRAAYLEFVENVEPHLKKIGFEIDRKIICSPLADELDQERYGVLLRDLKVAIELFRDENVPLQTEETKLDQQYDQTCGAMTVVFQGEERTMPQMARFQEDTDRAVREESWKASADRRYQDHQEINDIFDRLIQLRVQIARNAGFDNFRDYKHRAKQRFDYTPKDCEAFHQGAEEVCVPLFRTLNRERAEALEVETLRPWDMSVDIQGRAPLRPFENGSELEDGSSRLFKAMDQELSDMFETLRDGTSLDLESRKGKAPGGYQYFRDRSRQPFIFMNAAGVHRDLDTMIHEAGHAFHSMLCKDDPLLHYRHAPIEFAEVASMSMELFAFPYLDKFYSEADAARAKREHLERKMQLLPWIATIDAFQHWLYLNPDHSRGERTKQWLSLNDRFGAAVDWSGLEHHLEVQWQRQGHLFGVPFYYIEYGIAQLGALQLWLQYKKDPQHAIANYKKAMTLGGSKPLPELFAAAELTFDFGPATMRKLIDEVQSELETLPH